MQIGIVVTYKKFSNEPEYHVYWPSDTHSGLGSQ